MLKVATFLVVGYFGFSYSQEWSDSYMEAYRASHQDGPTVAKGDAMDGMSNFEFQMAALKPIIGIVTTIAKILLKIAVFKMIIKFAAIICLLFFIPWLKLPELISPKSKETRRLQEANFHKIIDMVSTKYEQ